MYILYTTYVSKIKKIKKGEIISIIMRKPFLTKNNSLGLLFNPELSPSPSLLSLYKNKKITWDEYEKIFLKEINNNKNAIETINLIDQALYYNDIYICCCEKDNAHCHRRLIGNILKEKGHKIQEF